jgi:hypothetical protein
MSKKPARTWSIFRTIPIYFSLFALHYYLPSYESHRALTLILFNLVMCLITFDLMLANMAAYDFMSIHPAFLLLILPLVAYFGLHVSASVEIYLTMGCALFAFGYFVLKMTLLAIQFYDYTGKRFLLNTNQEQGKVKQA